MLLLWNMFVIYVSCLSCFLVCSLQPCGHLLALLYVMFSCVFYHFPMWCPGSSVVVYIPDLCFLTYFDLGFSVHWEGAPQSPVVNMDSNLSFHPASPSYEYYVKFANFLKRCLFVGQHFYSICHQAV